MALWISLWPVFEVHQRVGWDHIRALRPDITLELQVARKPHSGRLAIKNHIAIFIKSNRVKANSSWCLTRCN